MRSFSVTVTVESGTLHPGDLCEPLAPPGPAVPGWLPFRSPSGTFAGTLDHIMLRGIERGPAAIFGLPLPTVCRAA